MIALTQEKRQKRINWLNARISSTEEARDEMPFGLSEDEEMELAAYKDSLASLTAEPIAHADSKAIIKMLKGHTRFFTSFPERSEAKRVGLFTAPPVQEIKIPNELMDLVKAVEFYHTVKAENPEVEIGAWNDAYDWIKKAAVEAAPVVKRLFAGGT